MSVSLQVDMRFLALFFPFFFSYSVTEANVVRLTRDGIRVRSTPVGDSLIKHW